MELETRKRIISVLVHGDKILNLGYRHPVPIGVRVGTQSTHHLSKHLQVRNLHIDVRSSGLKNHYWRFNLISKTFQHLGALAVNNRLELSQRVTKRPGVDRTQTAAVDVDTSGCCHPFNTCQVLPYWSAGQVRSRVQHNDTISGFNMNLVGAIRNLRNTVLVPGCTAVI